MASTRPLEIFNDPETSEGRDMLSHSLHDLDARVTFDPKLQINYNLTGGVVLQPSSTGASGRSPLKTITQPSTSAPKIHLCDRAHVSLPPPQATTFRTDSPFKKAIPSMSLPTAPLWASGPSFTTFATSLANKENSIPPYHSDNFADFPDPSYTYKAPLKRTVSCAPSSQDYPVKKPRSEEPMAPMLPAPQSLPAVEDDGKKPSHKYAMLIGMSILRSPTRRLTLAQIYKWISDTFTHYRYAESGWQNSIRHNLSLNKAFVKQERPKDDPGKGNYWAIAPGMEAQFLKDKSSCRPTSSSGPGVRSSSQLLTSETSSWPTQIALETRSLPRPADVLEPSSDATLIASDAPSSIGEDVETSDTIPPPTSHLQHSSPHNIHSSPPIPADTTLLNDTPPSIQLGLRHANHPRVRRRNSTEMDDSGYFSSLDSSATRPYPNSVLPQCDSGWPRTKRGRAEEEIARIRSSSHDISPSKDRSIWKQPTPSLVSSSPIRHFDSSLMLPPLTPAFEFKMPAKPPASISPNTNLRNHRNKIRELVGSPVKNTNLIGDEVTFSPAFKIVDDESYVCSDDLGTHFSVFADTLKGGSPRPILGSPKKRSTRRPHADRTNKSANILANITATGPNTRPSIFGAHIPGYDSPLKQKSSGSPLSFSGNDEVIPKEDLFGLDFPEDEEPDESGDLDILRGFQKIGGARQSGIPTQVSRSVLGARNNISLL